jgi:DNA topoisomerase I
VRDETKYERMVAFAEALPVIRRAVADRLKSPQLSREKVLATAVRLLELTFIRVGNEAYARDNGSFGLTTLRTRHVDVNGSAIHFRFRGKSHVERTIDLCDRRIANVLRRCQELPGEVLFQYVNADGQPHAIEASDVNDTIREVSGQDFSAKDFRTWAGTMLAATHLRKLEPAPSATAAKKSITSVIQRVARRLGNTPAVCRKCYVHPALLVAYSTGSLADAFPQVVDEAPTGGDPHELTAEERAVVVFLRGQA